MCVQRIKVGDPEIEPWRQQNLYGGRARGQQDNADMIILPHDLIGRKRPVCVFSVSLFNFSHCGHICHILMSHAASSSCLAFNCTRQKVNYRHRCLLWAELMCTAVKYSKRHGSIQCQRNCRILGDSLFALKTWHGIALSPNGGFRTHSLSPFCIPPCASVSVITPAVCRWAGEDSAAAPALKWLSFLTLCAYLT